MPPLPDATLHQSDAPTAPRFLTLLQLVPAPPLLVRREPGINLRLTSVRTPPWNPDHGLAMRVAENLLGICLLGFALLSSWGILLNQP